MVSFKRLIGFQLNMSDDDACIYNAFSFLQAGLGSEDVKENMVSNSISLMAHSGARMLQIVF